MDDGRLDGPVADCPPLLDGAGVLWWAALDEASSSSRLLEQDETGVTRRSRYRGIAIAQYSSKSSDGDQEKRFYVFFCDADWNVVNDLLEDSFEDAMSAVRTATQGLRVIVQE